MIERGGWKWRRWWRAYKGAHSLLFLLSKFSLSLFVRSSGCCRVSNSHIWNPNRECYCHSHKFLISNSNSNSDPLMALLAASGGDTVKLFDASTVKPGVYTPAGDCCALSFTPSPGSQVNSVKWNHTSESISPFLLLSRVCISPNCYRFYVIWGFRRFGCGQCWRWQEDLAMAEEWAEYGDHSHCRHW